MARKRAKPRERGGLVIDIRGDEELMARLKAASRGEVRSRVIKPGLREGGALVLEDARRRVPRGVTSRLADSLRLKLSVVRAVISAGTAEAYYARWVEFGHGGKRGPAAPRPFMRPALWENKSRIAEAFGRHLQSFVRSLRP